jgi:hypothetical protein
MLHKPSQVLVEQPFLVFVDTGGDVFIHGVYPVTHGDGEGVQPVVMAQAAFVLGDAGHLVEQLVVLVLGLEVAADDRLIDDQAMLVQHRFQGVDDPQFLAGGLTNPFRVDGGGVDALEYRFQEFLEHPVTEIHRVQQSALCSARPLGLPYVAIRIGLYLSPEGDRLFRATWPYGFRLVSTRYLVRSSLGIVSKRVPPN